MLTGCDQSAMKSESASAEENRPDVTPTKQERKVNAALDAVAKDLAAALKNRPVRTLVKKETGTLLAGQHNVLYETIASKKIGGESKTSSRTFEEVLAGQRASLAKDGKALSTSEAVKRVREDAAAIPKFDIGVPVRHKQWNPQETTPLVAFHHRREIDDTKLERIKAYDAEGNVHWLDAQEEPKRPVVVVGINERTTADGKIHPVYREVRPASKRDGQTIIPPDDGYGGGGMRYENSPRESGDKEYVQRWTCKDDEEPWIREGAEIKAIYNGIADPDASIETFYFGELDDGSTETVDKFLFTWDWGEYGDKVAVFWYEADGGSAGITEREIFQTEFEFEYGYKGDELGTAGLENTDPPGIEYKLSKVNFVPAWDD